MRKRNIFDKGETGFSLFELIIAMAITLTVMTVAMTLIAKSLKVRARALPLCQGVRLGTSTYGRNVVPAADTPASGPADHSGRVYSPLSAELVVTRLRLRPSSGNNAQRSSPPGRSARR